MDELASGRDFTRADEYVAAHGSSLLALGVALSGSIAEAEDLVQTTLLKLLVTWPEHATDLDAYVRRMLVNEFLDRRRRFALGRTLMARLSPTSVEADPAVAVVERSQRCYLSSRTSLADSEQPLCCATTRTCQTT